jgi:hypothetical protein
VACALFSARLPSTTKLSLLEVGKQLDTFSDQLREMVELTPSHRFVLDELMQHV